MKFYRVHKTQNSGESVGSAFFTTKRAAEKEFREWMSGEEEWVLSCEGTSLEVIEIEPTKQGILRALNKWASHADNG